MRKQFPGYFSPDKAQFDEMWGRGLIIPDANILLHLLRYGRDTRQQVLGAFRAFQPRLWVPNRVAFEFLRRWRDVEAESRTAFEKLKADIRKEGAAMGKLFDSVSRQQVIDLAAERAKISEFVGAICASIDEAAKKHPTLEESENIVGEVSDLIGEAVGEKPSEEQKQEWIRVAKDRFAAKVPPGYKDDPEKQGEDKFGDFFIWEEMIAIAKERSLPVIFVSDDRKEDWAVKRDGKDLGPRPDLMQEFAERSGQAFYSYPLRVFLKHAESYSAVAVTDEAIAEIKKEEDRQREDDARKDAVIDLVGQSIQPSAGTAISTNALRSLLDPRANTRAGKLIQDLNELAAADRLHEVSISPTLASLIADELARNEVTRLSLNPTSATAALREALAKHTLISLEPLAPETITRALWKARMQDQAVRQLYEAHGIDALRVDVPPGTQGDAGGASEAEGDRGPDRNEAGQDDGGEQES